jgi:CRP/FNR family transcriptional regulator, cyclic AMP receptor protein
MDAVDQRDPLPLIHTLRSARLAGAIRELLAGQILIRQGEAPDGIHVVEAGAVCLASVSPSGRRAVVAILGPGDAFGVEGVVLDGDRPLRPEARAMIRSRILSIRRGLLDSTPELAASIATSAAGALDRAHRRLARILTEGVQDRVRHTVADLARSHGRPVPGGIRIDLPVTQDLIASMVGATRESVNRALRHLSRDGVVVRSAGRYELRNDHEPGSS